MSRTYFVAVTFHVIPFNPHDTSIRRDFPSILQVKKLMYRLYRWPEPLAPADGFAKLRFVSGFGGL